MRLSTLSSTLCSTLALVALIPLGTWTSPAQASHFFARAPAGVSQGEVLYPSARSQQLKVNPFTSYMLVQQDARIEITRQQCKTLPHSPERKDVQAICKNLPKPTQSIAAISSFANSFLNVRVLDAHGWNPEAFFADYNERLLGEPYQLSVSQRRALEHCPVSLPGVRFAADCLRVNSFLTAIFSQIQLTTDNYDVIGALTKEISRVESAYNHANPEASHDIPKDLTSRTGSAEANAQGVPESLKFAGIVESLGNPLFDQNALLPLMVWKFRALWPQQAAGWFAVGGYSLVDPLTPTTLEIYQPKEYPAVLNKFVQAFYKVHDLKPEPGQEAVVEYAKYFSQTCDAFGDFKLTEWAQTLGYDQRHPFWLNNSLGLHALSRYCNLFHQLAQNK